MPFTAEQFAELTAPLDPRHVKEREQAGRKLHYVEAWHCIAEANRIFGHDGWDREMTDCRCVAERETKIGKPPYERDGWRVGYVARVRIVVHGERDVVREGTGYGSGIDVDLGQAHESAIKEAESDAMKRGLMTFGNPFGLSLYDKDNPTKPGAVRPLDAQQPSHPTAKPAKSAVAKSNDEETLSQIRDRIKRALSLANDRLLPDKILEINRDDLAAIKQGAPNTYDRLIAYSEQRKAEISAAGAGSGR